MLPPMAERIRSKLATLRPTRLVIEDESGQHVGHPGARPGGESHFRLEIVSPAFAGESRVERQPCWRRNSEAACTPCDSRP